MERRIFVFVSAGSRAVHPGAVSLLDARTPSVAKRRSLGVGDGGDVVERARALLDSSTLFCLPLELFGDLFVLVREKRPRVARVRAASRRRRR